MRNVRYYDYNLTFSQRLFLDRFSCEIRLEVETIANRETEQFKQPSTERKPHLFFIFWSPTRVTFLDDRNQDNFIIRVKL